MDDTPIDEKELTELLRTRGLVYTVSNFEYKYLKDSGSALANTIVSLLNAPEAPSVNLYIEEAFDKLDSGKFFFVQNFLNSLIPYLNIDLDELLYFVTHLTSKGSNDSRASPPSRAFGDWSKKDPTRSHKIYEAVRSRDKNAMCQLSIVLQANVHIDESILFTQSNESEVKLAAISALGHMELADKYEEVLGTLLEKMGGDDERIVIRALESAYSAAVRRQAIAPDTVDEQLERVLQFGSSFTIHMAASLLSFHQKGLSERALDLCLDAVLNVDADNMGTISCIDHAAYQLVENENIKKAIHLLGQLFDRSKGRFTLETFQSTYYAIQNAGSDILGDAVVYWLLYESMYTRKIVASKVCEVGNKPPPFSISASSLPPTPSDQLFLCRKAVGWFFIDPLAAIAIPLAVLRHGSLEIENDILNLIYDPLLLSYGNSLKNHLECYVADGEANCVGIEELLKRQSALKDELNGIDRLVELHPSEAQREADRIHWSEINLGIEAQRQRSPLEELFTRQHILYGHSTLTEIHTGDGATSLNETEMKLLSISSELPLLNIVDPVGLDYMLFLFKFETRG